MTPPKDEAKIDLKISFPKEGEREKWVMDRLFARNHFRPILREIAAGHTRKVNAIGAKQNGAEMT